MKEEFKDCPWFIQANTLDEVDVTNCVKFTTTKDDKGDLYKNQPAKDGYYIFMLCNKTIRGANFRSTKTIPITLIIVGKFSTERDRI